MKKLLLAFFLLIGCNQFIFSQGNETQWNMKSDSIWALYKNPTISDTTKLQTLRSFALDYEYRNLDSLLFLGQLIHAYADSIQNATYRAIGLNLQGSYYARSRKYEEAFNAYRASITILEENNLEDEIPNMLLALGTLYMVTNQPDSSFLCYDKAIKIGEKIGNQAVVASGLGRKGRLYYELQQNEDAEKCLKESIRIYKSIDQDENNEWNHYILGNLYNVEGNTIEGIKHLQLAIKKFEDKGQNTASAYLKTNLGEIYAAQGDADKAMELWRESIKVLEFHGEKTGVAENYLKIGIYFLNTKQPDSTLLIVNKAKQIFEAFNIEDGVALSFGLLGSAYMLKENYPKALLNVKKALTIQEKLKDGFGEAKSRLSLGRIYTLTKNYEEGIEENKKALKIATEIQHLDPQKEIYETLVKQYKGLKDYKNALDAYESFIMLKDSLKNENSQRELYRQESKYEYEKQALADSLQFAQQQQITQATVQNQRLGLIAGAFALLFLLALAYAIYKSRQRAQAETDRVKELDAFKSKFYTNITHEFRTPLTVILGMIQQIKENPKKNLDEGVTLIERNGKNLLNQINQILDLSKLETKSFNLNPVTDDLVSFVRYAAMSFQSNANSRNLSLRFFTPLEKLTAQFDPDALQKIVQNLVSNALKFTPSAGEVKVYLTQNGENIELKVQDTGVGIAEAELPHIFDRFYQVENPADKTQEGTGIGLAYVQELVRVMKGDISVESQVGVGTAFVVTLPLMMNDELAMVNGGVASAPPNPLKGELASEVNQNGSASMDENITNVANSTAAMAGGSSPLETGGARSTKPTHHSPLTTNNSPQLLIIEDNPDVVAYLKNCLADQYQIDIAYNGKIGIEKAVENIPDLIITDVMMPEVGGYEVCDTLKNDERTSHIPIIMLTAKADMASKIAGLKRGADVYLSKPFDKEELLTRMEMMVERQRKLATYFTNTLQNGVAENATETIEAEVIEMEDVFIQKVKSIVEKNYRDEGFGLPQLCSKIGMSRSQLFRKMKALIGASPSGFIRDYRLTKAKELLEKGEMNVSEVAWETGFTNLAHFSKVFQEKFGMPPSATNK